MSAYITYKMEIIRIPEIFVWLVLIVFAALFGLHWLRLYTIDGHTMKGVDLLAIFAIRSREVGR